MLIVHSLVVLSFVLLGVMFLRGKGAFLIAGYNTSSQEEKAKYNEEALCKFMGKTMFALAGCWVVIAFSAVFDSVIPLFVGMGLFCAVIVFILVYANTGNRFRK